MVRYFHALLFCICTGILFWITCTLPSNQAEDPKNSTVMFLPDGNNTVQQGNTKKIGMRVMYPQHINFYSVTSTCGNLDTTIQPTLLNDEDTVFFNPQFQTEGICTLQVIAEYLDNSFKAKTDSLIMVVLSGEPVLAFSVTPAAFTTHTGKTDTLLFVMDASYTDNINYTIACNPELDSTEVQLITPVSSDTILIHFDPAVADTYTVTLNATAGDLSTSASVAVTVLESITPNSSENPQTLITEIPDTLVFTLTPEQVANGVVMQLLDALDLPAEIATVIPNGLDSILIAVNSATEGTLSFSIVTTNGVFTDTTGYTFTFVDQNNAVWTTTSTSVDAVEGQQCSVDLSLYLFEGILIEQVSPTVSLGSITSSGTWQYTLPWGSETSVPVTITGKRGETSQDLSLTLNVAPGDGAAPEIILLSPSTESKTVSSSQTTVSVIVKDAGAGVDKVTFTTASGTFDGSMENDSTWSVEITGLTEGTAAEVIITATDKSMKKNSCSETISLTYDSSMEDGEAPVFSQTAGPESGDRVTSATGTITYTITDDSGVDSVWWTLNDVFIAAVTSSDSNYTISYELPDFGENSIKFFAKDGATGGNEGSRSITLNYNTKVTSVTPSGPQDKATDVSLTPSFTWTGGTDADGDSVFYRVVYGTAATSLSQMTAVLTSNMTTLGSAQALSPTTEYFWQVIAWSKAYPDTVQSSVFSFTTLDPTAEDTVGPQIAQTAGPEDGDRVTAATGTITVSVSDPNNVASVTAKLNSGTALALTAGTNNTYAYNYNLNSYGENTITFTAIDGSVNSNPSEESVTLNYNTKPAAITLTNPAPGASDVSVSPTFKWTGGDDEDGESVVVTVSYGTSQTSLSSTATVSGKMAAVSSPLAYNQTYYWQVTAKSASTEYPDVVQSSAGTFTTGGSQPTISVHPLSQTKEEGQSVTFSVTASANGFGTLSYQWRRNETTNVGTNSSSYSISSVTTAMNDTKYDCVVTNAVGSTTSDEATLTVTSIPSFTVSFDMHGGTAIASQSVVRGENAQEPPAPQRSGYAFKGWYTSSAFTTAFDFATPITANRTIHARWVQVYTVTYYSNTADGGNVPTDSRKYESGEMVTVAGNTGTLYKNGYTFSGWTTNSGGTGTVYNNPNTIQVGSSAITLYAKWEMNPPSITTPISNKNCPVNDSVTFTVVATGVNLSYVWQLNGTEISGATGSSYTTSKLTKSDVSASRTYRCIVSNTAGSDDCSATLSVSTVSDVDGNVYHQVKIGTQVWMMENLKTTKYRNGSLIIHASNAASWENQSSLGNYAWPQFDISNKVYGAIYDWAAVETGQLAPTGWRVPTETDWNTLFDAWPDCELIDPTYWNLNMDVVCSNGVINTTSFSAPAPGYITTTGSFTFKNGAFWWISESLIAKMEYSRSWVLNISSYLTFNGCSVRCLKE